MNRLFLIFFFISTFFAQAQQALTWFDLSAGISWNNNTSSESVPGFKEATFSEEMRTLEGKQVSISGYFLSLGTSQSVTMLSKNPMASCFFCGASGPETIMELQFKEKPSFVIDDVITVKGILRLNRDDPAHCYYQIDQAEAISLK